MVDRGPGRVLGERVRAAGDDVLDRADRLAGGVGGRRRELQGRSQPRAGRPSRRVEIHNTARQQPGDASRDHPVRVAVAGPRPGDLAGRRKISRDDRIVRCEPLAASGRITRSLSIGVRRGGVIGDGRRLLTGVVVVHRQHCQRRSADRAIGARGDH